MKARTTIARELKQLRGMRSRLGLTDAEKWRLDAMIQALRWVLNADGDEWTAPRWYTSITPRNRQELY